MADETSPTVLVSRAWLWRLLKAIRQPTDLADLVAVVAVLEHDLSAMLSGAHDDNRAA